MPTDNAVAKPAKQTNDSVRSLMDAVRAGKRLNDAADTILHYYESLVAMQTEIDARVRSAIEVEASRLLAERAEQCEAYQSLLSTTAALDNALRAALCFIEGESKDPKHIVIARICALLSRIGGGK